MGLKKKKEEKLDFWQCSVKLYLKLFYDWHVTMNFLSQFLFEIQQRDLRYM